MFIEAFKYKQWADQRTLEAISSINGTNYPAALDFSLQQLNHMVRVEEIFRARLEGKSIPHLSTNSESVPELGELARRISASNQWFHIYAERLAANQHQQVVAFEFVDKKRGSMTRLEILFHIINHGTYHRGAIGHCLDLSEVPHPADTYTVFIHAAEPERRN